MAIRGYPRFTVDVDLLTADNEVLDPALWESLVRDGAAVEPRRHRIGRVVTALGVAPNRVDLLTTIDGVYAKPWSSDTQRMKRNREKAKRWDEQIDLSRALRGVPVPAADSVRQRHRALAAGLIRL